MATRQKPAKFLQMERKWPPRETLQRVRRQRARFRPRACIAVPGNGTEETDTIEKKTTRWIDFTAQPGGQHAQDPAYSKHPTAGRNRANVYRRRPKIDRPRRQESSLAPQTAPLARGYPR